MTEARKEKEEKLIHTLRVRKGMSLETPFLLALLSFEEVREKLIILGYRFAANLRLEFVSPAQLREPANLERNELTAHHRKLLEQGILYFNVGDEKGQGLIDHHGDELGLCALDLLRGYHDFLEDLPWLPGLYLLVSDNDSKGTALSTGQNVRTLMTGLCCQNWHERTALDIMKLACLGAFECCRTSADEEGYIEKIGKVISLENIKIAVGRCRPGFSNWFNKTCEEALEALAQDWKQACVDVDRAKKEKRRWKVWHPVLSPILKRDLTVIAVHSRTYQAAKATRSKGYRYDLAIVFKPGGGEYQMYSAYIAEWGDEEGKPPVRTWMINLAEVAKALRWAEAKLAKPRRFLKEEDWAATGLIYDKRGNLVPVFLADFLTMVASRTPATLNVPNTILRHDKVTDEAVEHLTDCSLLIQGEDNEKIPWEWEERPPRIDQDQRERSGVGNGQDHNHQGGNGRGHHVFGHNMTIAIPARSGK